MVNGVGDKTRTDGGVRSIEDMDRAIIDLTTKFESMSTVLNEIRSAIGGVNNKHPTREGNEHGNYRLRPNNDGFLRNHARNQSPKQAWRHDEVMFSDEEGDDEAYDEFGDGLRGGNPRRRPMARRNVNHQGYGERQGYRVKAEIPNFVGNLDIEAVLDWLYEVDKFFDIMDVPDYEQVKIVAYKLRGGAGAWWQNEQDNRRRQGKYPINTWPRMKRMIKGRFLPP